jgi:hypothetical protein
MSSVKDDTVGRLDSFGSLARLGRGSDPSANFNRRNRTLRTFWSTRDSGNGFDSMFSTIAIVYLKFELNQLQDLVRSSFKELAQ